MTCEEKCDSDARCGCRRAQFSLFRRTWNRGFPGTGHRRIPRGAAHGPGSGDRSSATSRPRAVEHYPLDLGLRGWVRAHIHTHNPDGAKPHSREDKSPFLGSIRPIPYTRTRRSRGNRALGSARGHCLIAQVLPQRGPRLRPVVVGMGNVHSLPRGTTPDPFFSGTATCCDA